MPNEMMMETGAMPSGGMGTSPSAVDDLQLVMTFLQNIKPGDMSPEAAQQLMAIGQGVQNGVMLTPDQREMFKSVVGEIDRFPVEQMDTFPQGTNPDIMKQQMAPAQGMAPMQDMAPAPQGNVMSLQEAIEAGFVTPTRPQPRPTAPMTSMRPQTRRTR
jgi:hypothetical protein